MGVEINTPHDERPDLRPTSQPEPAPLAERTGRILILVENLSVPFDRRVWQESRALSEAGHEVHVICPMGSGRDEEAEVVLEGVHIHRFPLRPAVGGPTGYLREYGLALIHTARLTFKHGLVRPFDVIQACNPPDLLLLPVLPLKFRGTRFVFDHHDLVPELFLSRFGRSAKLLHQLTVLLERVTFGLAHTVISTNESYRKVAIDRGKMDPERVHVVRSAPDLSRFQPTEPNESLKNGKPFLTCYLGVMGPQDGIDYALRSLAYLRDELGRTDVHSVFIGGGDAFDDMVALSKELNLEDMVEFTGRISNEAVCEYLSTADVCLAPDPKNPLNDVSTMNKIVEYMAMSRPLVSFDLVEARVSAGDAAVYARPNDEAEFGRLIGELLDDPAKRAEMGHIGRTRVEENLSWSTSRQNLVRAYDSIIAG